MRKITSSPVVRALVCAVMFLPVLCHADPVADWRTFERAVRDGSITKSAAKERLPSLVAQLRASYALTVNPPAGRWAFPIEGYTVSAIKPRDYKPNARYGPKNVKGYDFFAGNRHGGHPAHDIFIKDKNQDSLDDKTKKPANAVAMADAVVVSVCREWASNKKLRGGNYVWLYNPAGDTFMYYAHLNRVEVEDGTLVRAGDVIGTVGRTGLLADKKASPTHVHLMVLQYRDGAMHPVDYYPQLQ